MAERVDVSRLSVAECMALGGGGAEPAKEEGLQGKLEKLVQEIGLGETSSCEYTILYIYIYILAR